MMMVPFDRQNGLHTRYILPIKVPFTIDTMINFDGHGYGKVTSKQTFRCSEGLSSDVTVEDALKRQILR